MVESFLARRSTGIGLMIVLAAAYTWAYCYHPLFPVGAAEARQGWWSWFDQFMLWKSAAELAHLRVTPEGSYYPLGYPLLGAVFWWLMPAHAFFVPDLMCVLGAAYVWWRLARRWLSRVQTLAVMILFIFAHRQLLALTVVIPWNTIVTQCTLLAGIWILTTKSGFRAVMGLTALAMATYVVRPADAASFAPLLIWAVLRLPAWTLRFKAAVSGMLLLGGVVIMVRFLNHAVHGPDGSAYDRIIWDTLGFGAYRLDHKLFSILVDGRPFFGEADTALFFKYPWLLLAIPGAFYWILRERGAGVAGVLAIALNWTLYLNFNDFYVSGIFRYSLIHYLSWAFPVLFVSVAAALLKGWRERAVQLGFAAACLLAVVASGLQLRAREISVPVVVGGVNELPSQRPLWIRFEGVSVDRVTMLRLDGREMHEALDYQIPYVPSDLYLMLSSHARGVSLSAQGEVDIKVSPKVGDFVWDWQFEFSRWKEARGWMNR